LRIDIMKLKLKQIYRTRFEINNINVKSYDMKYHILN